MLPPVSASVPALALVAACCSAGATILIRQGLRRYGPYTGFWINLFVGTAALWVAVLLSGGPGRVSRSGVAFFVLSGLIGTVAGRLLRFISIETVGASITAALINLSPLVSTALAIVLLGEHVTAPVVIGTLVIVIGTTLLSAGGRSLGVRPVTLALPLLSAACFGIVAVIRKIGLADTDAVTGSAVNTTTALIAFTAFLVASGQGGAIACRGRSLAYFIAAGVTENLGVFLTIVALGLGTVSVVGPLTAVSPIFVLVLSFVFLRGIEALNARVVVGTVLIVLGVYLITALHAR